MLLKQHHQLFKEIIEAVIEYLPYEPPAWEYLEDNESSPMLADICKFVHGYIGYMAFTAPKRQHGTPCSKAFIANQLNMEVFQFQDLVMEYDLKYAFEVTDHFLVASDLKINETWCRKQMDILIDCFPHSHFERDEQS